IFIQNSLYSFTGSFFVRIQQLDAGFYLIPIIGRYQPFFLLLSSVVTPRGASPSRSGQSSPAPRSRLMVKPGKRILRLHSRQGTLPSYDKFSLFTYWEFFGF